MTKQTPIMKKKAEKNGRKYRSLLEQAMVARETSREDIHLNLREAIKEGAREIAGRVYYGATPQFMDTYSGDLCDCVEDLCTLRYSLILVGPCYNSHYEKLPIMLDQLDALIRNKLLNNE